MFYVKYYVRNVELIGCINFNFIFTGMFQDLQRKSSHPVGNDFESLPS